jgi:hypothetical protein
VSDHHDRLVRAANVLLAAGCLHQAGVVVA